MWSKSALLAFALLMTAFGMNGICFKFVQQPSCSDVSGCKFALGPATECIGFNVSFTHSGWTKTFVSVFQRCSKLTLISIKQYFGLDQTADIQVNVKGFDHVGFYFIFFFFSQHHIFAGAPYSSICPC
jgi:hypothetical protein